MEYRRSVQALVDGGVDFVIIGGLAASFHGSARVTLDLDICYLRSAENLRKLVRCLDPFHPRPRGFPSNLPFVWDERTLHNGSLFTLDTDIGPIDLLAEVTGVGTYSDAFQHSVEVEAYQRKIRTLDLPSLIRAKRAAGRQKDLEYLHELESLLESGEPES